MEKILIPVLVFTLELTGVVGLYVVKSDANKTDYYVTQRPLHTDVSIPETAKETHSMNINVHKLEKQISELEDEVEAAERKQRKVKKQPKTYGIRLTGDIGVIWNNINDLKIAYAVGKKNKEIKKRNDKPELRAGRTDEEINSSAKFEDELEKQDIDDTVIGKSIKSGKTYGMSLAGDHGTVWNNLNGVSYQVGESSNDSDEVEDSTDDSTEDEVAETETKPNVNDISDILKPSEASTEYQDLSSEIDDSFTEVDEGLNEVTKETDDSNYNTNNKTVDEITDIKEVLNNETAKLEDRVNNVTNPNKKDDNKNGNQNIANDKKGDDGLSTEANITTENSKEDANPEDNNDDDADDDKAFEFPDAIQTLINNEPFWQWLNDWSSTYAEMLMVHLDSHIKAEVAKQIKEYIATHAHEKLENNNQDNNTSEAVVDENADNIKNIDNTAPTSDSNNNAVNEIKDVDVNEDELSTKKRKDKDCEDKNEKKEVPLNINANNLYGNSVGNGKVTNVFIYNIGKELDLGNIVALSNGTNGIYIFGNDDKISDENNENDKVGNNDPAKNETSTETLLNPPDDLEIKDTAVEEVTSRPDESSEKPVEGTKPDEMTANPIGTSTDLPETAVPKDNDATENKVDENTTSEDNKSSHDEPKNPLEDTAADKETPELDVESNSDIATESVKENEKPVDNKDSKENDKTENDNHTANSMRNEDETTPPESDENNFADEFLEQIEHIQDPRTLMNFLDN